MSGFFFTKLWSYYVHGLLSTRPTPSSLILSRQYIHSRWNSQWDPLMNTNMEPNYNWHPKHIPIFLMDWTLLVQDHISKIAKLFICSFFFQDNPPSILIFWNSVPSPSEFLLPSAGPPCLLLTPAWWGEWGNCWTWATIGGRSHVIQKGGSLGSLGISRFRALASPSNQLFLPNPKPRNILQMHVWISAPATTIVKDSEH